MRLLAWRFLQSVSMSANIGGGGGQPHVEGELRWGREAIAFDLLCSAGLDLLCCRSRSEAVETEQPVNPTTNKVCFYIMRVDTGFAPNPFHGVCTLAACTPNHQHARLFKGDLIAGCFRS